jgi:arylsulfatase A-like enzyme
VPAFAYWPGVIEPGSVVGDIVHVTDLFTTFARLGGKMEGIPTDRVIESAGKRATSSARSQISTTLMAPTCLGWEVRMGP